VTEVRNFMELLNAKWAENKFVCVGLDSDVEKLPMRHLANSEQEVTKFLAAQEHYVLELQQQLLRGGRRDKAR
jgi:hypothetical protein